MSIAFLFMYLYVDRERFSIMLKCFFLLDDILKQHNVKQTDVQ